MKYKLHDLRLFYHKSIYSGVYRGKRLIFARRFLSDQLEPLYEIRSYDDVTIDKLSLRKRKELSDVIIIESKKLKY